MDPHEFIPYNAQRVIALHGIAARGWRKSTFNFGHLLTCGVQKYVVKMNTCHDGNPNQEWRFSEWDEYS